MVISKRNQDSILFIGAAEEIQIAEYLIRCSLV